MEDKYGVRVNEKSPEHLKLIGEQFIAIADALGRGELEHESGYIRVDQKSTPVQVPSVNGYMLEYEAGRLSIHISADLRFVEACPGPKPEKSPQNPHIEDQRC